jgi:hypothetical protein
VFAIRIFASLLEMVSAEALVDDLAYKCLAAIATWKNVFIAKLRLLFGQEVAATRDAKSGASDR